MAPRLSVGADGELYLSWLEQPSASQATLRFSRWSADGWSPATTVATGTDWFVNWADVPSVQALEDGTLGAHWLAKSGADTYAYDVWLSTSADGGQTWTPPQRAHSDGTKTEHGFVTLVPRPGHFEVVWLDGREMVKAQPMTLRWGRLLADGTMAESRVVDERVCECCPTDALALDASTTLVAYRDRSTREIRDIRTAELQPRSLRDGGAVHDDGWHTPGCPVNGPAMALNGNRVAVAWYTEGGDGPTVRTAFRQRLGGSDFETPIEIDAGAPLGRVDLTWVDERTVMTSWLERGEDQAFLSIRRVGVDGSLGPICAVAEVTRARSSGFPRMVAHRGHLILVWTAWDSDDRATTDSKQSRLRSTRLALDACS